MSVFLRMHLDRKFNFCIRGIRKVQVASFGMLSLVNKVHGQRGQVLICSSSYPLKSSVFLLEVVPIALFETVKFHVFFSVSLEFFIFLACICCFLSICSGHTQKRTICKKLRILVLAVNTYTSYFYMLTKIWRICEHSSNVVTSVVSQQAHWIFGIRP